MLLKFRLGDEWKEPVHSKAMSESRELLPDESDDEDEETVERVSEKTQIQERKENIKGTIFN